MTTLTLTGKQAKGLAWDEPDPDWGYAVELNEQVGTKRWTSVHRLVIRDGDGKLWAACYEEGLTENQDSEPFEYQDEVEFSEVEKVPVTTYEYRPAKSEVVR